MIKHIVMWNVRGTGAEDREATAGEIRALLESLPAKVPGIRYLEVGINELKGDQACDLVLITTFDDWSALADYGVHPEHVRVAERIRELTTARMSADYAFER